MPLIVEGIKGEWFIRDPDGLREECGPYETKDEAEDDRRGLERFYAQHTTTEERETTMTATITKPRKKAPRKASSKKATPKVATKPAPVAKKAKPVKTAPVKKAPVKDGGSMTQIDAAVKWLGNQSKPKTVAEIVAGCAERGYWKSPAGKSPQRTLATNLLREMAKDASRVSKVGRGLFELTA